MKRTSVAKARAISKSWAIMMIAFTLIISTALLTDAAPQRESAVVTQETVLASVANDAPRPALSESELFLYALQDRYRSVADVTLPAVVEINVVELVRQRRPSTPFWPFGNQGPEEREFRQQGLGSGVILQSDGNRHYVITNEHVVGSADEISLTLYDGRQYEAQIVGKDPRTDLALVVFETREPVPLIAVGDSDTLRVGDIVFAVGNPLGFEATVTSGIVSALGRQAQDGGPIATFTDYIQTDASINPGNSGGALVNLAGELVGINSWIASRSGGSVGIGFAIPVSTMKKAVDAFIRDGQVTYGWLGVSIANMDERPAVDLADDLDLGDRTGAFVLNVFEGSPARKAGLLPGDLIVGVGDLGVADSSQLTRAIGNVPPGSDRTLAVIRSGRQINIVTRLDARDDEAELRAWPGFIVAELDRELRESLELENNLRGVIVAAVLENTRAESAGLRQGDVITSVDNRRVREPSDFFNMLSRLDGDQFSLGVSRQGEDIELSL
jgi:serine protease Do